MAKGRKTHRGLAKRFKVSAKGVVKGTKCGYHHKNMKKSSKRVRQARHGVTVTGNLRKSFLKLLSS